MSQKSYTQSLSKSTGLSESVINAAWPTWWSDAAQNSPSAQAELKFSLARKLGLDPMSLISDKPKFMWSKNAKFKSFSGDTLNESPAISSFGVSLSKMLFQATPHNSDLGGYSALEIRKAILASSSYNFIQLTDLLSLLWGVGVPVIHLRLFPLAAKRMSAMCVGANERSAILLAKDTSYPAAITFYLAHELGHIVLGHLPSEGVVIDIDETEQHQTQIKDDEERAADRFALELLTGDPEFSVLKVGAGDNAKELAQRALNLGQTLSVEPGAILMSYGYSTREWALVYSAMKHVYKQAIPVWKVINTLAKTQLNLETLSDDNNAYLMAVLGSGA